MLVAALCVCPSRSSFTPRPTALQSVPVSYLFALNDILAVASWKRYDKTVKSFARLGLSLETRIHSAVLAKSLEMSEVGVSRLSHGESTVRMTKWSEVHRAG
jgi:hypothetical protein